MNSILSIFVLTLLIPIAAAEHSNLDPNHSVIDQDHSSYNNDPFNKPQHITPLTLPDSWPTNIHRNPINRSPPNIQTSLVMLGTGMPSPNPYRGGPSHAVVIGDSTYLVDAGEGIWRSIAKAALINGDDFSQALSPEKISTLFLTHLHQDHTVGIPSLILNPLNWIYGINLKIYGPKGTKDMLDHIVSAWRIDTEAAIADGFDPANSGATGHDIVFEENGLVYQDNNVKVEAFRTRHASLQDTFAYRFTTVDRVIVFTGDGGPFHANIVRAAKNADILVTETVTEDNIRYAPWGGNTVEAKKKEIFRFHFSPTVLARIANQAGVRKIVLAHEQNYNSGENYNALGLSDEVKAAGFAGEIFSAMDGDIY